jgi:hypothetical protein
MMLGEDGGPHPAKGDGVLQHRTTVRYAFVLESALPYPIAPQCVTLWVSVSRY